MSSHHIVRDEQEPALLIADTTQISFEMVGDLLEWSPVTLVFSKALDQVLAWGIKVDVVICKPEEVEMVQEKVIFQQPIEVLSTSGNFIDFAFHFLANKQHHAVNICTNISPKAAYQFASSSLDVVVYTLAFKGVFAKDNTFEKWVTATTEFLLVPQEETTTIQTTGLQEVAPSHFKATQTGLVKWEGNNVFFVAEMYEN